MKKFFEQEKNRTNKICQLNHNAIIQNHNVVIHNHLDPIQH